MDYSYVPYRPEFRQSILQLQTHLWGPDLSLNSAYFSWKYERNPFSPSPLLAVGLWDGKVAAVRGFHGAEWQFGFEGRMACFCACDLVVDPAHRNKNIHKRVTDLGLDELSKKGHSLVLNFSANPANYLSSLRTGWRLVVPYSAVRRETSRARLLRRCISRVGNTPLIWRFADRIRGLSAFSGVRGLDGTPFIPMPGGKLRVAAQADPGLLAGIAQQCMRQEVLSHVRSPEYFAWRFENPMHDYRFLMSESSPGYLVLQSRKGSSSRVHLVDWQAATGQILIRMVEALLASGRVHSLAIWKASIPGSAHARLAELGFTAVDESRGVSSYVPGLLIKTLTPSAPVLAGHDVSHSSRWDLRMIYSDSF